MLLRPEPFDLEPEVSVDEAKRDGDEGGAGSGERGGKTKGGGPVTDAAKSRARGVDKGERGG